MSGTRLCLFLSILVSIAFCDELYVSTAGSDGGGCTLASPCQTIEYALSTMAKSGDVIYLSGGTYSGSGNTAINWDTTVYNITIRGEPDVTIIDGEGIHNLFFVSSCLGNPNAMIGAYLPLVTFYGITFTGANCNVSLFQECEQTSELVNYGGSAFYARDNCSISFINCTFTRNRCGPIIGQTVTGLRGVVHVRGSELLMKNVVFEHNDIDVDSSDGALMLFRTKVEIDGCTFRNNTVLDIGGAIRFFDEMDVIMRRSTVIGNHALSAGGIGSFGLTKTSRVLLEDLEIVGNFASGGGGGMIARGGNYIINRVNFIGNIGVPGGGGLEIDSSTNSTIITNCRFEANNATQFGGGITYNAGAGHLEIHNSVFIKNIAENGAGLWAAEDTYMLVNDCRFDSNSATKQGGAILMYDGIVQNCKFSNNTVYAIEMLDLGTLKSNEFESNEPEDVAGQVKNFVDNDLRSIRVSAPWDISVPTSVPKLRMVDGSLELRESLTIEQGMVWDTAGVIEGVETTKRSTLNQLILKTNTTSTFTLGALELRSMCLRSQGHLKVISRPNIAFTMHDTRLEVDSGSFEIGERVELEGNRSQIIVHNGATIVIEGTAKSRVPWELKLGSTVEMVLDTSVLEMLASIKLGGLLRITGLPKAISVGDEYTVMKYGSGNITNKFDNLQMPNRNFNGRLEYRETEIKLIVLDKDRSLRPTTWTDSTALVLLVLAAIGIVLVFALQTILITHWSSSFILRSSSPPFLATLIVGALISYLGVIVWAAPIDDVICELRIWLPFVGFIVLFAPLLAKTYRIVRIFTGLKNLKVVTISIWSIVQMTTAFIIAEIIVLILWSASSPTRKELIPDKTDDDFSIAKCTSDRALIFLIALIAYNGGLLLWGCWLSFRARKVPMHFNESKWIGLSIYNICVWMALLLILGFAVNDAGEALFSVTTGLAIWMSTTGTLLMLFTHKVWIVYHPQKDKIRSNYQSHEKPDMDLTHFSEGTERAVHTESVEYMALLDKYNAVKAERDEIKQELESIKRTLVV